MPITYTLWSPYVHRSYTATRDTGRSEIFTFAFSTLFCYSGWSQIVRVIISF